MAGGALARVESVERIWVQICEVDEATVQLRRRCSAELLLYDMVGDRRRLRRRCDQRDERGEGKGGAGGAHLEYSARRVLNPLELEL